MKLTKVERDGIKNLFGGKCAYCGCELENKWHADHVKPIFRGWGDEVDIAHRGEDVIENLYPSCVSCNLSKGTYSLDYWRLELGRRVEMLIKYEKNFRLAVDFGQVEIKNTPVVFWFERFEESYESLRCKCI